MSSSSAACYRMTIIEGRQVCVYRMTKPFNVEDPPVLYGMMKPIHIESFRVSYGMTKPLNLEDTQV